MKQGHPKVYTWVFTDGVKFILQSDENGVTDSVLDLLCQIDQRDANDRRRYRRHNISLESFVDSIDRSLLLMDVRADTEDAVLDQLEEQYWHDRLAESLAQLSPSQIRLLEQVFLEELSLREIARREGVCDNVIRKRLKGTLKKLKRNFP